MIIIDHTHLGRHVTGIERVTLSLFSGARLAGLDAVCVRSSGLASMLFAQTVRLPALALLNRDALVVCPGFPPSIPLTLAAGSRVIPYIHDLFLLTQRETLNAKARLYMAPAFDLAVRRLGLFLVNSLTTAGELSRFCRADAEILPCRPPVDNVFGLSPRPRADSAAGLRVAMLGTVEPRKNYRYAAEIRDRLEGLVPGPVELHVIGRPGWGDDFAALAGRPGVVMHGYLETEQANAVIGGSDVFLSTSLDEGLGLPLLEAQYAGLPVVAPDMPVFREVLGDSGSFISATDPEAAARVIAGLASAGRDGAARASVANVARWNGLAEADWRRVSGMLAARAQGRTLAGAHP